MKKAPSKKFLALINGVKSIQTVGYNDARRVDVIIFGQNFGDFAHSKEVGLKII
jgi:hypothetical protein